jgi:hypothetical protein
MESHEKAVQVVSKIFLPAEIPEVLDQLIQESFSRSKLSKKKARPMNGAAKGKKRPRPASEAKQASPSAKKMRPQKTPKRKSVDEDFEMAVSLSERRRSGRNREVKNYREMSDDENDSPAPQFSSSRGGGAKSNGPESGARVEATAKDSDILSLDTDMSE